MSRKDVKIAPGAVVCSESELQGDISIGTRTVIHPKARIIAECGPIKIGESNLIEERVEIINNVPNSVMIVGDFNVFEVGARCQSREVGDSNVFESKCFVGPKVRISNGCIIGAMCNVTAPGSIPENTVIYGEKMDSGSYSLPSTMNVISTSGNEQKRPVPGATARKAGGGGGPGPLNSDTPGPFLFEGPEGQAPTSVLATGLGDPTRLDPSIAAGLSMSSNFAGSSSVAKGATMQESFIQAVIAAGQLDLLLTRLSGLSRERSRFVDFEEVFSIAVPSSSVANPIAGAAGATGSSVSVRVRRSLLPAGDNPAAALPVLRYLGSVESEKTVLRRSCLEVPTSGPLVNFLCSLGFKKDFDFVAEGHIFIRGRAKVLVYSVNQVEQYSHESGLALPKSWRNLLPRSYMVEVSAVGSPADDSLPKEVSGLMELLCPLVVPGRVDHARLVCR